MVLSMLVETFHKVDNRLKKKSRGDGMFFLAYGLIISFSLLAESFYFRYFDEFPFTMLQLCCVGILGLWELYNGGVDRKDWPAMFVCGGFCVLAIIIAESNVQRLVGWVFLATFCARRIPFPKIADFTLRVSCVVVAFIVLSGYLGIIDDVVVHKSGRIREYLGFRYALYPSGILLNMTALYVYVRKNRITVLGALVWGVINWYVYYMTDSRISFLLAELLLVAGLAMRWMPKLVRKLHVWWGALVASFAVCGGLSMIMISCYNSRIPWMRRLNSALEGRLNLGKRSLTKYGVTLFGQKIEWIGNGLDVNGNPVEQTYDYVDCLYVKVLQRYGLVFSVLLLVLITWAMFRLWKRREYHLLLISATVAVHCLLDDLSFSLHYNTFWIALGIVLIAPSMLPWNGKTNQLSLPRRE